MGLSPKRRLETEIVGLGGGALDGALGATEKTITTYMQDCMLTKFVRGRGSAEDENIRFIVLRLKRTRNPDMVSLGRFDHFLHDMQSHGVTVLLCGVRPAFLKAMKSLHFHDWLPADRIFPEEEKKYSATIKAVRYVYELLDQNSCEHCQNVQKGWAEAERQALYYLV